MSGPYGININFLVNNGSVTVAATNTSQQSVSYSGLTLATGVDVATFFTADQFINGLATGQQVPLTPPTQPSGTLAPNSTVTLATFTPSTSSSKYDGGSVMLNGDPVPYALARQGGPLPQNTPAMGVVGVLILAVALASFGYRSMRRRQSLVGSPA